MLIKDAILVLDEFEKRGDIRIEDGKIDKISSNISPKKDEKIIDAKGCYLLPGVIDLNVRVLNDVLNKKSLELLFKDAKNGGVLAFVLMSDFAPSKQNETFLQLLDAKLKKANRSDLVITACALTDEGKLNDISTLLKCGAKVISANSDIDGNLLKRVMQYSNMKDVPLFCFCEDKSLSDNGVMNDGNVSFRLGLPGKPKISEISEVAKVAQMALYYNTKIHFQSVSTYDSLQIIKKAKEQNNNIFCEVSINNLILNDEACDDFNTYAKLNPPLRDEKERQKLIYALKTGMIDTITSAHSPKSVLYKDVPFEEAKFGVDSLANFLSLCYTYLVKNSTISICELSKLISKNPAKILGIEK